MKRVRGPAAALALFAPRGCRKLDHKHCSKGGCPCDEARAWLRTLPATMTLKAMWDACPDVGWKNWLAHRFGCRGIDSYTTLAKAMATPPKKRRRKCEGCDETFDAADLSSDGYCEDCYSDRVYCTICDCTHPDDNQPCEHLRWSDAAGAYVGTGTGDDDVERSLDALCSRIGLRLTRKLRALLVAGDFEALWPRYYYRFGNGILDRIREAERDDPRDNGTEVGRLYLITLDGTASIKPDVDRVIGWIDAHIKRREAAIAADARPRHVIRDGAGRYWIDGAWTPIRDNARWMDAARGRKRRDVLRQAYPGTKIRAVHVLTPAPAFKEGKR